MKKEGLYPPELSRKWERLFEYLTSLNSLAVGFSGGADSSFLLAAAREALGEKVIALTAVHPAFLKEEQEAAAAFCRERGIRHVLFSFDPFGEEEYRKGGKNRCYACKKALFTEMERIARERGARYVAEGANQDDESDYRPGMRATKELGVITPLRAVGFTKAEIRLLSEKMGLPTWDKPSSACLASRVAYGEEITPEKLRMIGEAERYLTHLGFFGVRVRLHGRLARIEVAPKDVSRLFHEDLRETIKRELQNLGFLYVTADLGGYRMGSMNDEVFM